VPRTRPCAWRRYSHWRSSRCGRPPTTE
jgi:hypothetical protein